MWGSSYGLSKFPQGVTSFSCLKRFLLNSASSLCCSAVSLMNSWEQCGLMLMPMKPLSPTELKITSRDLGSIPGSVSGPVVTKAIRSCFDILSTEASGVLRFKVKDLYLSPVAIHFSLVSSRMNGKKNKLIKQNNLLYKHLCTDVQWQIWM